jgi:hypothetical protein
VDSIEEKWVCFACKQKVKKANPEEKILIPA